MGRKKTHGKSNTKLYEVCKAMRRRTKRENSQAYENYGGRGIGICEEWEKDFETFYKWAIENGYREGLSIDRKDNNKGYNPDNCRWTTRKVQNNNTRANRMVTYRGETHTVREWEEMLMLGENVLKMRLNNGWSIERAMTTPAIKYRKMRNKKKTSRHFLQFPEKKG